MAQRLNDMVKDVGKYSDELARKHKVVKESESNTVEAIQVPLFWTAQPHFVFSKLNTFVSQICSFWIRQMWPYSDRKKHTFNEEEN